MLTCIHVFDFLVTWVLPSQTHIDIYANCDSDTAIWFSFAGFYTQTEAGLWDTHI